MLNILEPNDRPTQGWFTNCEHTGGERLPVRLPDIPKVSKSYLILRKSYIFRRQRTMGVEFGEPPLLENTGDILWWQEAWKQLNDMKGHGRSLGLEGGFQGNAEETIRKPRVFPSKYKAFLEILQPNLSLLVCECGPVATLILCCS